MLTHTLRAFSLVGLILIAHTIKPFSLGNVTAFARHTLRSFAFVLPAETMERLERAGELAALLGNGWGANDSLAGQMADRLVAFKANFSAAETNYALPLKAKSLNKQLSSAGKATRHAAQTARGLQARNRTSQGVDPEAAPLPIIPGIEASLIPSVTLMELPLSPTTTGDAVQDSSSAQPKVLNLECEWRSSFEKTWIPEEALLKLQEVQFSAPTLKVRVLNQRASKGQACPQAGKATDSRSTNGKSSC